MASATLSPTPPTHLHEPSEVDAAIEQTRGFLNGMKDKVGEVHRRGGTLKEAFEVQAIVEQILKAPPCQ